ncbi:MAG TPA: LysM domain-containing protein [Dermatophilaceae bacterium]
MPFRLSPTGARPIAAVALAAVSLVVAAAVGSIFLSTSSDAWTAITASGPASPADGILIVVALGGALLSLWVGLGTALSALSALPGALGQASTLLAARIAPTAVRKVVAFVLGTALSAALVPGTAVARTGHEAPRAAVVASAQYAAGALGSAVDSAPNASFSLVSDAVHTSNTIHAIHARNETDRAPAPSWSPERSTPSANSEDRVVELVVHRGDSLWSIAARHLGREATTSQIDAEWHRWFAANRLVIGDDPNAIRPGQVLSSPTSAPAEQSAQGAS